MQRCTVPSDAGVTLRPMTISLHAEERPPLLRRFLDDLSDALDGDGRVWASLVAGDEATPQSVTVFVDVYDVIEEEAALKRLEPALRQADPDLRIVRARANLQRRWTPRAEQTASTCAAVLPLAF